MFSQVVMIIDLRKDVPLKYKKIIQQESKIVTVLVNEEEKILDMIKDVEPEIIIITDNFTRSAVNICEEIRAEVKNYRPVIVALSKSDFLDDKLEMLKAGADDYLSEPIDPVELKHRIVAHLRRHSEESCHPITGLSNRKTTYKVINRTIALDRKWSLMFISLNNLAQYEDVYGHIAADKLLKTFAAIAKSAVDENDYIGHFYNNSLIIFTHPFKAEKIASYINFAFDSVVERFYNEDDLTRGYLMASGDTKPGVRTNFVTSSIGIISNEYRKYASSHEAIRNLLNVHKIAQLQPDSAWVSDKPQLCGECAAKHHVLPRVLIVEPDAALAYLLTTTLEMQGYQSSAISNYEEVFDAIKLEEPDIIIIDAGNTEELKGLNISKEIKSNRDLADIKIIVSSIVHDKELVLNTGADLYLPKPFDLAHLYNWIGRLLNPVY